METPPPPPDLEAAWTEAGEHLQAGRLEAAIPHLTLAATSPDETLATAAYGALADVYTGLAQWPQARRAALAAQALAVQAGERADADELAAMVATADALARLYPEGIPRALDARDRLEAAIAAYRTTRDPLEEIAHLQTARAAAHDGHMPGEEAGLLGGLADRLQRLGDHPAARAALQRACLIVQVLGQESAEDHFAARLAALPEG